jgi:hypothetical protein
MMRTRTSTRRILLTRVAWVVPDASWADSGGTMTTLWVEGEVLCAAGLVAGVEMGAVGTPPAGVDGVLVGVGVGVGVCVGNVVVGVGVGVGVTDVGADVVGVGVGVGPASCWSFLTTALACAFSLAVSGR